jgi:hypothetical protein
MCPDQIKTGEPIPKPTKAKRTGGVSQVVEHLSRKHEASSSNSGSAKKKKKKKKQPKSLPPAYYIHPVPAFPQQQPLSSDHVHVHEPLFSCRSLLPDK